VDVRVIAATNRDLRTEVTERRPQRPVLSPFDGRNSCAVPGAAQRGPSITRAALSGQIRRPIFQEHATSRRGRESCSVCTHGQATCASWKTRLATPA
jgi:hypothetical protein